MAENIVALFMGLAGIAIPAGIIYGIVRLCKGIYRLLDKLIDKL